MTEQEFEQLKETRAVFIESVRTLRDELNKVLRYAPDLGFKAYATLEYDEVTKSETFFTLELHNPGGELMLEANERPSPTPKTIAPVYMGVVIEGARPERNEELRGLCRGCGEVDWSLTSQGERLGIPETLAMKLRPYEQGGYVVCQSCGKGLVYTGYTYEEIVQLHNETFDTQAARAAADHLLTASRNSVKTEGYNVITPYLGEGDSGMHSLDPPEVNDPME